MARIEIHLMGAKLVTEDRQCGLRADVRLVLLTHNRHGLHCSADRQKPCARRGEDGCHLREKEAGGELPAKGRL